MMYSFAARGDCRVVDEPFYAAYLAQSGAVHPLGDEVIASQPTDPDVVAERLIAPVSEPLFYQKHMTHHMLPDWPYSWMGRVKNVFLIRHPARVIASYAKKREAPQLSDLGFLQQAEMFKSVADPIVIDSSDIRADPPVMLQKLCARLDIPWTPNMLSWPSGGHAADGVWARHWYGAVHRSTGFDSAEGALPTLDSAYARIVDAAMPSYEALAKFKLT